MMLFRNKAPANFVPAAAVKRRGQVLFVMTGCKAYVGCFFKLRTKFDKKKMSKALILILNLSTNSN